ncbi:MAG TPA: peptidase, partial [Armatimonadota bacterium]|nr:peptidase [Armatimonadota bacterium]
AKDLAIRRAIEKGNPAEGMQWADLEQAIDLEFRENEIFPKSDVVEDWLKLIDYEPENVVTVKPIRPDRGRGRAARHTVI